MASGERIDLANLAPGMHVARPIPIKNPFAETTHHAMYLGKAITLLESLTPEQLDKEFQVKQDSEIVSAREWLREKSDHTDIFIEYNGYSVVLTSDFELSEAFPIEPSYYALSFEKRNKQIVMLPPEISIPRILARLGEARYNLRNNNCEMLINEAILGEEKLCTQFEITEENMAETIGFGEIGRVASRFALSLFGSLANSPK